MNSDMSEIKSSLPLVSVVIINYCGFSDTVCAVESVLDSTYKDVRVVVVDNASPDNTGVKLFKQFSGAERVSVVLLDENVGFGSGNNVGIKLAIDNGSDYVLLVNNDTVVDCRMIEALVEEAGRNTVVSPLVFYYSEPNSVWFGGGYFDWWGAPRHLFRNREANNVGVDSYSSEWLTGCSMFFPIKAFLDTGGFDPNYFLYCEDVDWSIRLVRAGYSLMVNPQARMWHKVSATTGGADSPLSYYYGARNRLYMIRKLNLGMKYRIISILSILRGVLSKKSRYQWAGKAFRDYLAGRMGRAAL